MNAHPTKGLLRVCAWCQAEGTRPAPGPNQTHTICERHMREVLAPLKARLTAAAKEEPRVTTVQP